MNCRHKPQDPKWMISTEYGRYFTFDHVQRCKKCGARIEMAHKTLYKLLLGVIALSNLFWFFLYVYYDGESFLPIIPIIIAVGLALWTGYFSGGCMAWKAIELGKTQSDESQETQNGRKAPPQGERAEAMDNSEGGIPDKSAQAEQNLPYPIHKAKSHKACLRAEIGICVVVLCLIYYIAIPALSRMAPPFHVFHIKAEDVKMIVATQSDESKSVIATRTIVSPEEIEDMVEKLNDVHYRFWVLFMPSSNEGYFLEIQEKDGTKEFFEVQPNRVSVGLGYFADMRFVTDLFSEYDIP